MVFEHPERIHDWSDSASINSRSGSVCLLNSEQLVQHADGSICDTIAVFALSSSVMTINSVLSVFMTIEQRHVFTSNNTRCSSHS